MRKHFLRPNVIEERKKEEEWCKNLEKVNKPRVYLVKNSLPQNHGSSFFFSHCDLLVSSYNFSLNHQTLTPRETCKSNHHIIYICYLN